jgi:hypothetical protein
MPVDVESLKTAVFNESISELEKYLTSFKRKEKDKLKLKLNTVSSP